MCRNANCVAHIYQDTHTMQNRIYTTGFCSEQCRKYVQNHTTNQRIEESAVSHVRKLASRMIEDIPPTKRSR